MKKRPPVKIDDFRHDQIMLVYLNEVQGIRDKALQSLPQEKVGIKDSSFTYLVFVVAIITLFLTLFTTLIDYPLWIPLAGFVLASLGVAQNRYRNHLVKKAYAKALAKVEQDPIYARSCLILEAGSEYAQKRKLFYHCLKMVKEGLVEVDQDLIDRYVRYLIKARSVIEKARDNLLETRDFEEHKREFLKKNPLPQQEPPDAALSQLMAKIDQPVEVPKLQATGVRVALEHEEALAEIVSDPLGEAELIARIEALPKTNP